MSAVALIALYAAGGLLTLWAAHRYVMPVLAALRWALLLLPLLLVGRAFLAALAAFLFFEEIGLTDGAAFFGASAWMLSHGLAIKVG
ncbi:MAG: hypothetical protein ABR576_07690 [Thermoanaerobaculia bacterium]